MWRSYIWSYEDDIDSVFGELAGGGEHGGGVASDDNEGGVEFVGDTVVDEGVSNNEGVGVEESNKERELLICNRIYCGNNKI